MGEQDLGDEDNFGEGLGGWGLGDQADLGDQDNLRDQDLGDKDDFGDQDLGDQDNLGDHDLEDQQDDLGGSGQLGESGIWRSRWLGGSGCMELHADQESSINKFKIAPLVAKKVTFYP